jgi:hypothetical protein
VIERARLHKAMDVLRSEIFTEISNLNSIFENSAHALDNFRRHFRRLVAINIIVPFVAGVVALLIEATSGWATTALAIVAGVLNLGLGTAQLYWESHGYNRQAAAHKHICDLTQAALARIQKELPSNEQLNLLSDGQMAVALTDLRKLKDYTIDEVQACRSAAVGTIVTLVSKIPKSQVNASDPQEISRI